MDKSAKTVVTVSLFVVCLLFGTAEATGNFVTISLPKGVSLDLPKNWTALSNNQRITLDASVESRQDLSGIQVMDSKLPFAANYYNDRDETIGIMNIRYYPQSEVTQAEAAAATESDVQELDTALKSNLDKEMKAYNMPILAWAGTKKTTINGITAFITEYRRKSPKGASEFKVRLVRVFAGDRSFTLTVSHLDAASIMLQPITDRIIGSLKLVGVDESAAPRSAGPPSEAGKNTSALSAIYGESWWLVLALSAAMTWGIGLAPPLLLRFVFLRRPLGKRWAIGITTLFWFVNLTLFTALGSKSKSHGALLLVAFASYAILRRRSAKAPTGGEPVGT